MTGGLPPLTLEQRCVALNDPRTDVAALNMGSVNFNDDVYVNRLPDICYWARPNAKLVQKIAELIRLLGHEAATPEDAGGILGIS